MRYSTLLLSVLAFCAMYASAAPVPEDSASTEVDASAPQENDTDDAFAYQWRN
ncbi:hypothetical protein UA08_01853 [Talaromyces atroroseus]|uniref:Uncharacterized protein n=1 Tax=Talaromyces atroroseus TaxID=1441469 RepID=A0A1Q5QAC6_TALAT|nr:hypothetical protein UA08_01853 [Talaromyces atroroseus]OKL62897.1 hypothetical protein UA08_01853 [Talaromyces atroroseus]